MERLEGFLNNTTRGKECDMPHMTQSVWLLHTYRHNIPEHGRQMKRTVVVDVLEVNRSSVLDQHVYHTLSLVVHGGVVEWCLSSSLLDGGVSAADQQVFYHGDVPHSGGKVEAGPPVGVSVRGWLHNTYGTSGSQWNWGQFS